MTSTNERQTMTRNDHEQRPDEDRSIFGLRLRSLDLKSHGKTFLRRRGVDAGRFGVYRHTFTREDLLRVLIVTSEDLELDFRAWLLDTLGSGMLNPSAHWLAFWAEDRVGDGAWLGTVLDDLEGVLELEAALEPGTMIRLVDVDRARAELEELLPC